MDENKNITIKDFVLEYKNFMSKEWCEEVIKFFRTAKECGFTFSRDAFLDVPKHYINDNSISMSDILIYEFPLEYSAIPHQFITKFFEDAYKKYANKYSMLSQSAPHGINTIKIQQTLPGEGFHVWHYENAASTAQSRIATFTLYLNDVKKGGETEFLYYPKRIKPEQGKLIIWPAGYTHTHRGNQPLSGEKYIITGWLEFNRV